jgi:hypothetical protein
MPYYVALPDGNRVEIPDDVSQADAYKRIITAFPQFAPPQRGIGQLASDALKRGGAYTGVLLGDYLPAYTSRAVQRGAEALGAESVAGAAGSFAERQLREAAQSELDIAKKYPREFEGIEDVTGPVSALRFGVETLAESVPSLATSAATAVAGGAIGGLLGGPAGAVAGAGAGLTAGRVAPAVASLAARRAAMTTGFFAGSAAQTIPADYAAILRETGKEELGVSLISGGISAALESVLPAAVIGKLSGPAREALVGSIGQRLGLGFAKGAAIEGLTEGTQEAVTKAAISFVDDNKEFFTSDNWKQILDSSIRGAIVGGVVGGVSNVALGRKGAPPAEGAPPAGTATVEGAPSGETPPGGVSATDTPEQAAFREQSFPALTNLGYQPEDIAALPFDRIQEILDKMIMADQYDAPAQAPVKQLPKEGDKPAPVETAPVAGVTPAPVETAPVAGVTPAPVETAPVAGVTPAPVETAPVAGVTPAPVETAPAPVEVAPAAGVAPAPVVPEVPAPTPAAPAELPVFDLPKPLAGAKPTFGFGTAQFDPQFVNGIDKALYITSQANKSASDDKYRQFLRDRGFTDAMINTFGTGIRAHMKEKARLAIEGGANGGPLPVDFMRSTGEVYQSILATAPSTPVSVAPAPKAPYIPKPPPPLPSPIVPTPLGVKPERAQIKMSPRVEQILEENIPGSTGVLRTLIQGFFPGTRFRIKSERVEDAYGQVATKFGFVPSDKPQFVVRIDTDRIKSIQQSSKDPEALKTYFLKTIFHELSHPLEFTHIAASDDKTLNAVLDQYQKARNVSSIERFALSQAIRNPDKLLDDAFMAKTLKAADLTREQYDAFIKSDAKKVPVEAGAGVTKTRVGENYQRSFSEWVAESGARFITNELENLVPKTTFEKFQKVALDNLRKLYQQISRMLGIQPTEGAFEQLLRDIYGNRITTPRAQPIQEGRPGTENIIKSKTALQNDGIEPTDVDVKAKEPAPAAAPQNTLERTKKRWNDIDSVIAKPDKSMTGFVGRIMQSVFGALPGESISRAIVRNAVNSNIPLLEREDTKNLGRFIEGMMNATGRMHGVVTIAPMGYSRVDKRFFYHTGKDAIPLLEVLEDIGTLKADQGQIVMLAARELALRKAGQSRRGAKSVLPNSVTRLSDQDLQDIIDSADPDVRKAMEKFQKFNDKMIEMSIQAGVIPRSLGEKFKTLMYTPMFRVHNEEVKDNPTVTLAGGIYDAIKDPQGIDAFNNRVGELSAGNPVHGNLYENVLRNYNMLVSAAVRNVAYQETANVLSRLKKDGSDTSIGEVFDKPFKGSIQFRVNGMDRYMLINDPAMFQSIAALSPQEKGVFVRVLSWFANLLRKGVTSTPPFQLRNTIRGLVELKIKTGMPIMDILRGTLDGVSDTWNKGDAYRAILARQGFGGFGFGSGSTDQAAYMERLYKSRELSWAQWEKYPNAFMRFFDKMERLGEVTEMAPRIAYYNFLKKNGASEQDATWEAVNLVNYHRHGQGNGVLGAAVSNLIPMTPFLTARIQGLYRLLEKGTEGGKTGLFGKKLEKETRFGIPMAIVSRGLMVTAINMAVNQMYGDDDWYKELTVKDRLANMYVKVGDVVLALPRAFEVGELFGALPTLLADSFRKQNGSDITSGALEFAKKTFLIEVTPQAFKPLYELYSNKNSFTGLPIETLTEKNRPKEERFDDYTSNFAKMVGHLSKYVELSPKQIDTLLRGYLGTSATLFLGTVDGLTSAGGTRPQGVFGDPASLTGVAANLSGVSAILKTESQLTNKFIGDFYEVKEKVTQIVNSMNDAARTGDVEKVKARLEQMPQARGLFTTFNRANEQLSAINGQIKLIQSRKDMTADQKTQLLEQLRDRKGLIAKQMVDLAERLGVTR